MPEVSRFYGIVIRFYYRDHPPMHFHAIYAEHEALIEKKQAIFTKGLYLKKLWSWLMSGGYFIYKNSRTLGTKAGGRFR